MAQFPARSLVPLLALLLASCERVVDTGMICLVPKTLECDCSSSDEPYDCTFNFPDYADGFQCDGTYPADVHYEVVAFLYEGGGGYVKNERCAAKLDGRHIQLTASFQHEPERDAIVEPGAIAHCDVGPLAAGVWVLGFGGNAVEVEVGDAELVQEMVCVESERRYTGHTR